MSSENNERQSFRNSSIALKNVLQSSNSLVPGCSVVAVLLTAVFITVAMLSDTIMMGITVIVVLLGTLIVYAGTNDYGEAALALVAGLLTVFSVDWTPGRFAIFVSSWTFFTLMALMLSSIKLASKNEEIYYDAAVALKSKDLKKTAKELEKISKDSNTKILGPIERAEVIRLFAYRKLSIQSMIPGLRAVDTLKTITHADHVTTALFIADVYRMFDSNSDERYKKLLDQMYDYIRSSSASPDEFLQAFGLSRRLVFTGELEPEKYFDLLNKALEIGTPIEAVFEYIRVQHTLAA